MKRIPMILMIIAPYAYLFVLIIVTYVIGTPRIDMIFLVSLIAVGILNLIYPFFLAKNASVRELLFWDMLIKLFNIPLYLVAILFLVWTAMGDNLVKFVIVTLIFDYFLVLSSSMYGLCGVLKARREGKIENSTAVLSIIAHLIIFIDALNAVIIYTDERRTLKVPEGQDKRFDWTDITYIGALFVKFCIRFFSRG